MPGPAFARREPVHSLDELSMSPSGLQKGHLGHDNINLPSLLRECLSCSILIADSSEKVIFAPSDLEKVLGPGPWSPPPESISHLPALLAELVRQTVREKRNLQRQFNLGPPGSDEEKNISVHSIYIAAEGKLAGSVVLIFNDLSFSKRLELYMRRLDLLASIGTLSASMAHEIKNAMVAVQTFLDLLLKQNQDAELAEIVSRELRRIDSIVSQMLKFAGPAKPTFSTVGLHSVLEHAIRLIEQKREEKQIALDLSLEATPDLVNGDDYQLEQAFFNLFLNALEAMPPAGKLTVITQRYSNRSALSEVSNGESLLKITVSDSGVGIPAENMNRLFEPFFTTKVNGTGLGLSITRRIIQEHGGNISVESQINHGTTFSIYLPGSLPTPG